MQDNLIRWSDIRDELMTPREIALSNEFVKRTGILIEQHERGEISDGEYERLLKELDDEHTSACERLYDEEFGDQSTTDAEKFFAPPNFAIA